MLLNIRFVVFFSSVISRIESIGGGGGWQLASRGRVKATIQIQIAVLCLQRVTETDTIYKGGQDRCEEQFGTPYNPINALWESGP